MNRNFGLGGLNKESKVASVFINGAKSFYDPQLDRASSMLNTMAQHNAQRAKLQDDAARAPSGQHN
jgi:hypothetical protein